MASSINRVVLTGNLTRDPELRQTTGGPVCRLRLAVNGRRRAADGSWAEEPNYFNVAVFGAQAEACARYLGKGRAAAIDGRLRWREWAEETGQRREAVEVIAETVQFLGGARDEQEPPAPAAIAATAPAAHATSGDEDDLPF
jgi:single-strand DNA-binding protein